MSCDSNMEAEKDRIFDTDPICDFSNLKKCLADMGVKIGQAGTWRSVGTVDVLPEDIGKRIFFEDGGFFILMMKV